MFLGTFSYSLYLVHAPVLETMQRFVIAPLGVGGLADFALLMVFVLPAVLLAAYGFFRLFSGPSLDRRDLASLRTLPLWQLLTARRGALRATPAVQESGLTARRRLPKAKRSSRPARRQSCKSACIPGATAGGSVRQGAVGLERTPPGGPGAPQEVPRCRIIRRCSPCAVRTAVSAFALVACLGMAPTAGAAVLPATPANFAAVFGAAAG